MSTPVTYVGNSYSVPAYGDSGYAQGAGNLSSYLVALATGSLTLSGGSFPLTADANFGANFGLVSIYYKSRSSNIATTGIVRLAVADVIAWRNNLNNANLSLAVNASDQLTFNGSVLVPSGGAASFTDITLTNTTNQIVMGTTNTTTISSVAPAASRTYTIPDAGGAASFIMSLGAQTITGAKTFADQTLLLQETGSTDVITINVAALAASRAYTMPDAGGSADFVMTAGAQTITGAKTFASSALLLQEASSTDVITIAVASLASGLTYTIPDAGAAASFIMSAGSQTIGGTKTFTSPIPIAPTGAGDAYVGMTINGGQAWTIGADDSDSDAFVLSASATPGTTNVFRASSAGAMTYPLQPAFLALNGAGATDVTGDNTVYTVQWPTEVFDRAGNFASNTFTAPVTGLYAFTVQVFLRQIGAAHTNIIINLVTTARSYQYTVVQGAQLYSSICLPISVLANMTANDTATVTIQVNGSTKTVDVDNNNNWFSAYLVA